MRRMNLGASLVILGLASVALGWLIPVNVPSAHDAGDLPPTLMPILSMVVLAFMALLLGVSALRQKKDTQGVTQNEEEDEPLVFGREEAVNLLLWLAVAVVIWFLLKSVGFLAAAGVTIVAGTVYGGLRNPWIITSSAVAIPLLIDKIVWYGLNIRLP